MSEANKLELVNFSISQEIGSRKLHIDTEYNINLFKTKEDEEKLKLIANKVLDDINNFFEE